MITGFINSKNVIDIQYDQNFLKIIEEKQDKSVDKIVRNINKVAKNSGNPELIKEAQKIEKAIRKTKADTVKAISEKEIETNRRKKAEEKSNFLQTQNNFLKNDISDDTINLEAILHHIGLTTNLIKTDITNLVKSIDKNAPKEKLVDIVQRISRQNEKISSFSKYFKKVNFNVYSNKLDSDIVSFINEYIENVYKEREDLRANRELLKVKITNEDNSILKLKFNPIEIIIIFDNLINNSTKNKAKSISLRWDKVDNKTARLSFRDDGIGIKNNIIDNIFDFGFTTSRRGSGIGLYHVKEIIEKMKGSITVNNKTFKGVEFILTFNK